MKLKNKSNYKILKDYGFWETIKEEDLPENKFWLEGKDYSSEAINKMEAENKKIKETHFVIDSDYHPLYYYDDCMFYEIGHARRGQYYYLVFNIPINKFYILATNPDGSGCEKEMPDIIFKLIEDGVVVCG